MALASLSFLFGSQVPIMAQENEPVEQTANHTSWQSAMTDAIDSWQDLTGKYLARDNSVTLLDISADGIPAAWINTGYDFMSTTLLAWSGSEVVSNHLDAGTLFYIPQSNLIRLFSGRSGEYFDTIYQLYEGKLYPIAKGQYGLIAEDGQEADRFGDYKYKWDGKWMSKEEYNDRLNSIFDTSLALNAGEEIRLSFDQAKAELSAWSDLIVAAPAYSDVYSLYNPETGESVQVYDEWDKINRIQEGWILEGVRWKEPSFMLSSSLANVK